MLARSRAIVCRWWSTIAGGVLSFVCAILVVRVNIILFVSCAAIVSRLPILVSVNNLLFIGAFIALLAFIVMRSSRQKFRRLLWLALFAYGGFAYSSVHCANQFRSWLPQSLEGMDVELVGTVVKLPRVSRNAVRFRLKLSECPACWAPGHFVDLAWYVSGSLDKIASQSLGPGQHLHLVARLSRPRGTVNPGLFDYEGWLLSEGVVARGYVRTSEFMPIELQESIVGQWRSQPNRLRLWLRERVYAALPDSHIRGLITALLLGESSEITAEDWNDLSMTGTNHLLIVSGLHVGLVTAFSFRVFQWLFGGRVVGARRWSGALSLAIALCYGVVAGMGLPVQRALVMTIVALSGVLLNRSVSVVTMFCFALLLVTLLDPLASLRPGFWLSFGAVFSLLYAMNGKRVVPDATNFEKLLAWFRMALSTQWIVFVGTLPLLLYFVFQCSLLSFAMNLVAIPWIGLTVVPSLLVSIPAYAFETAAGDFLVRFAAESLELLWYFLHAGARLDWVFFARELSVFHVVAGFLGVLVVLAPRGMLPRWNGIILIATMFAPGFVGVENDLALGELEVTVIDVGQGLAVRVRSHDQVLQYDTGPRYGEGFDAGRSIIVPGLRRAGHSRFIDTLILSHGDIDHAGGAQAVMAQMLIGDRYGARGGKACGAGKFLSKDGIRYAFLPSQAAREKRENNRSCVVLVEGFDFAILLPGDIEAEGEANLRSFALPPVDLLLAPHHGSRSSSSPAFLNQVAPKAVVFSTGYANRFGHPDVDVLNRYAHRKIEMYNTAFDGAVTFKFQPGHMTVVETARSTSRRFWYDSGLLNQSKL